MTRSGTREQRLFAVAIATIALHVLVARPLLGVAAIGLAALLLAGFRRGGRALRTAIAGTAGLAATAAGFAVHLPHALLSDTRAADVTGVAAGLAGIVLVALACHAALGGTRRRTKLLAIPAVLVLIQWFVIPVVGGGLAVNTTHPDVPSATTLGLPGARDVTFSGADGTRLAGWYVPGRNGAAVVLMHGSHGTRASTETTCACSRAPATECSPTTRAATARAAVAPTRSAGTRPGT